MCRREMVLTKRWVLVFYIVVALVSCRHQGLKPKEGFLNVLGGPVWYRIIGTGTATPILLLHGGPGSCSCYLSALAALGNERPVVFYDQLGAGRSGRPTDMTLWHLDRFVDEVGAVRKQLGLTRIHLFGHSWGAALAIEHLLRKNTSGVVSLTLASPLLSTTRWISDTKLLRVKLPESIQKTLEQHEKEGTTNSDEYKKAAKDFTSRLMFHRGPKLKLPECRGSSNNPVVYEHMWGPTEFYVTGNLLDFDVTNHLSELDLPVLFVVGRYDEARPETMVEFLKFIAGSRLEILEESAHNAMVEEPERYVQILREFLRSVDSREAHRQASN